MKRVAVTEAALAMLLLHAGEMGPTVIRISDDRRIGITPDIDPRAMTEHKPGPRMTSAEAKRQNRAMRRK